MDADLVDAGDAPSPVGARRLLSGGNRLKLGLFGLNCSPGIHPEGSEGLESTWEHTLSVSQLADRLGFEILVPIARWRGMGGETNPFGSSFETMAWAAGIASRTEQIVPVGTLHLPMWHPVAAAKQAATIDHLAGGRFAFNAVMGWYAPDMRMFGIEMRDHERRYEFGAEWMDVVRRVWTEQEPFDYEGEFFQLSQVQGLPKPLQKPYPLIINAGNSAAGMDFAAREADFNFALVEDFEKGAEYVRRARAHARAEYDRDLQFLGNAFVICRDTEAEARRVAERILEQADHLAARGSLKEFGINSDSLSEEFLNEFLDKWIVGMASHQLIGTPEQIAEKLASYSEAGVSAVLIATPDHALSHARPDYHEELNIFNEKVVPLLVEMGLRDAVHGTAAE